MCGFAGFINRKNKLNDNFLKNISETLLHRGPDSFGIMTENNIEMVFRRLSIVDPVSSSDQPFQNIFKNITLMFNGEIYNYKDIRNSLKENGIKFVTNSDTEVILHGYEIWGNEIFKKLRGMFACSIYDKLKNKIILARDPLGIKPLYYYKKDNEFIYGSEVKVFKKYFANLECDIDSLMQILVYRSPYGKCSGYKDIYLLEPGSILEFDLKKNKLSKNYFFSLENTFCDNNLSNEGITDLSEKEIIDLTEQKIIESVLKHTQSDVGFSIMLSGGVDSSLISAIASQYSGKQIETYGIKIKNSRLDESEYQAQVAKQYNLNHHVIELDSNDFSNNLEKTTQILELPTAHLGCVFLQLLYKKISKKYKVCLIGEGADEMFGGYNRYNNLNKHYIKYLLSKSFFLFNKNIDIKKYKKFPFYLAPQIDANVFDLIQMLNFKFQFSSLNSQYPAKLNFKNSIFFGDQSNYLQSLLLRNDKLGMSCSVEARTPFADLEICKFSNQIPIYLRNQTNSTKRILKKVAERWLPKNLIYRKKIGLSLPIDEWLKDNENLKSQVLNLKENSEKINDYFDKKKISNYIDNFYKNNDNDKNCSKVVMKLLTLNLWLKNI